MHFALIPKLPVAVNRANKVAALVVSFLAGLNERKKQVTPIDNPVTAPDQPHERPDGVALRQPIRQAGRRHGRRHRTRGAELIEFTLNFLPFMIMITLVVNTAWAVFAQATLQQAVRMAVRQGVTLTAAETTNLTASVKAAVQAHSVGLLNGATGLSYIKVHYFDQDNPSLDVSVTASNSGNRGGNVMQVSIQGYPLSPLIARFYNWTGAVDRNPTQMVVYAADVIEPISSANTAPIGSAP